MSKALQVNLAPTADIHPAPWNVRTGHDVAGIAESIRINGFRDPIEVWRKTGEIVAGEGRYHAAVMLELVEVPVIFHDFDSLASAKRYAIANNRLTDKSEWDLPALTDTLGELDSLAGTGFDEAELPGLGGADASPPEDFASYDEDIETQFCCPKCGYEWSGRANAGGDDEASV